MYPFNYSDWRRFWCKTCLDAPRSSGLRCVMVQPVSRSRENGECRVGWIDKGMTKNQAVGSAGAKWLTQPRLRPVARPSDGLDAGWPSVQVTSVDEGTVRAGDSFFAAHPSLSTALTCYMFWRNEALLSWLIEERGRREGKDVISQQTAVVHDSSSVGTDVE